MTNDATRATAQALPKINRRKALALVGIGAASTAAVPAQGMAMMNTPSDLATIEGLIATHAEAYAENGKLWEVAGDLGTEPYCKVQVSTVYRGVDDEGNKLFDPLYAHSAEQIASHYGRSMDALLSVHGHGLNGEERARRIRENIAALIKEKQEELTALDAARERLSSGDGCCGRFDQCRAVDRSANSRHCPAVHGGGFKARTMGRRDLPDRSSLPLRPRGSSDCCPQFHRESRAVMSGSYVPEYVYGLIPGTYGQQYGLLPWPKHLQPRETPEIGLSKKGESCVAAALAEADGVFFITLSKDDRAGIAATVERLINMLDDMDGDENLEATGDDEPSLGWPGNGPSCLSADHLHGDDREWEVCDEPHDIIDCGDDEPDLGTTEDVDQLRRLWRAPGWAVDDGEPDLAGARSDREDDPAEFDHPGIIYGGDEYLQKVTP